MRTVELIFERMQSILNGSGDPGEAIKEEDLLEDWRMSLKEMASCGFDVSDLMAQLEHFKSERARKKMAEKRR